MNAVILEAPLLQEMHPSLGQNNSAQKNSSESSFIEILNGCQREQSQQSGEDNFEIHSKKLAEAEKNELSKNTEKEPFESDEKKVTFYKEVEENGHKYESEEIPSPENLLIVADEIHSENIKVDFSEIKADADDADIKQIENAAGIEELQNLNINWLSLENAEKNTESPATEENFNFMIENPEQYDSSAENGMENLDKAQFLCANNPEEFFAMMEKGNSFGQQFSEKKENDFSEMSLKTGGNEKGQKSKVRLSVTDLRTENAVRKTDGIPEKTENPGKINTKKIAEISSERQGKDSFQFNIDLGNEINRNINSSSQTVSDSNSVFQKMVSQAVVENAPEFVKAGNIVLKDGNQGNINLILHPEKLGNVKIALSLSEKVITASITVHSAEAFEAMREGIDALKSAFADSGFETGEFNLQFSNGETFAQSNGGHNADNSGAFFHAEREYSDYVASSSSVLVSDSDEDGNFSHSQVNIVA